MGRRLDVLLSFVQLVNEAMLRGIYIRMTDTINMHTDENLSA